MQTAVQPRGGHLSHKWDKCFSLTQIVSKLAEVRLVDNLRNQKREESEWPLVDIITISLRRPIIREIRAQQ